jgi:hypothetical protein
MVGLIRLLHRMKATRASKRRRLQIALLECGSFGTSNFKRR